MKHIIRVIVLIIAGVILQRTYALALEQVCPSALNDVRGLVLATAETMDTPVASIQLFHRESVDTEWRAVDPPKPAVVGVTGLGWGYSFRHLARTGEPIKIEGDK